MPSFGGHPDGTVTGVPAAGISLGEVVVVVSWCMAALAVIAAGFDAWAWHAYGDHWFGDHGPRFSEFALHHWTELEALRGLVRSLIGAVWAVGLTVTVAWWRRGPGAVGFARRRRAARIAVSCGLAALVLAVPGVWLLAVDTASGPVEAARHYVTALAANTLAGVAWIALAVVASCEDPRTDPAG